MNGQAGKGCRYRPVDQTAWDKGWAGIDWGHSPKECEPQAHQMRREEHNRRDVCVICGKVIDDRDARIKRMFPF